MLDNFDEKDQLIGFVLIVSDFIRSEPSRDGSTVAPTPPAPVDRSRSLNYLRRTARRVVKLCGKLEPKKVAALDRRLLDAGFRPFSSMRVAAYRWLLAILSEGEIPGRNIQNLVAKLSESDAVPLSPSERERLRAIVRAHSGKPA